eukprot:CAMPEP_0172611194 /NCGR_PEP_ID=MMETSP1068-20121228/30922_1 /TAXON_ID=35684 /ORGANISM="Pseudopedinella elastica, Strain CCMP716" /LENGTH=387 /DNA_ID=CAMNT_0013415111 /DNA_START=94 /DNA_END=1257 /DNA_ORIENTATION=+
MIETKTIGTELDKPPSRDKNIHVSSEKKPNSAENRKKSGEEMIAAPLVHPDESFWLVTLAVQCYYGDYWVLSFMLIEPLIIHLLCRAICTPGDPNRACNNIIPVDLRNEFSAPPEVIESIKGGKPVEATETARPNSEWIRFFRSSLAPDSMDHLDSKAQRLLCVLAQGRDYLPKASNTALAMILYSVVITGLVLSRYGWFKAAKCVAITGAHINIMHILRDHSISGLTHHGAHNVGEFDKVEFVNRNLIISAPFVLANLFVDWPILQMWASFSAIKCIALANHTLTHYTRLDTKGKGPGGGLLWDYVLSVHEFLAMCKIITSKQYHAQHHFHNEMSYPAILMPINEYLNAKALIPFLTRTMDEKGLMLVEGVANTMCLICLYGAMCR